MKYRGGAGGLSPLQVVVRQAQGCTCLLEVTEKPHLQGCGVHAYDVRFVVHSFCIASRALSSAL